MFSYAVLGSCASPTEADLAAAAAVTAAAARAELQTAVDSILLPGADTYVRSGPPNQVRGGERLLSVQGGGRERALVAFDPAGLVLAVGAGSLRAARLEFALTFNGNDWSPQGRPVALHRMTLPWTEAGATWNCSLDSDPANQRAACAGPTAWEMGPTGPNPWVAAPTATTTITNRQSGTVVFDVTVDVAAWLAGEANAGWILKAVHEGQNGRVHFGSRESPTPPRLVLTVEPLDTIWPVVTGNGPMLDTTRVVVQPGGEEPIVYFRTELIIVFEPGTSARARASFFARHSMDVLGVSPLGGSIDDGDYYVRVPDPGSTLEAYLALMATLQGEPETRYVLPLFRSGGIRPTMHSRFPQDGAGQVRADWLDATVGTWAMRAVRAPLAWGCETGNYGGALVRVGVIEWKHQRTNPDYSLSTPRVWEPPDDASLVATGRKLSPDTVVSFERHAAATTGLLTAQGDNALGLAGMMWRSQVYLYASASAGDWVPPLFRGWEEQAKAIARDDVRVLNLSVVGTLSDSLPPDQVTRLVQRLSDRLRVDLLDRLPNLLLVVAAGNDSIEATPDAYIRPGSEAEIGALLRLLQNPAYRDRIILVAGTRPGNALWPRSNRFPGLTDIAAPAANVTVLDRWGGGAGDGVTLKTTSGTSLAAPLVAGTAGLLLSMDPTLTAAQVKDYIVRGAVVGRGDP